MLSFLNGKFVPHAQANVSIDDHGFLYGDGIYETLRVYKGKVFLMEEHLRRLQHSADFIGLKLPLSKKKIAWALTETAARNHQPEAVLRLTITRGPGLYGFDPALCGKPTIAIVSRPFRAYPVAYHEQGIVLAVVSIRRNAVSSLPPHVKSTSCLNGIYAKVESLKAKAQEGLMLSQDGYLTEGTVSNVFLVKRKNIMTPILDGSLLAGTTRGFVLTLAKKAGIQFIEKRLRLSDLLAADEAFLTNTTMEVLPIRRLVLASALSKRTTHSFSSNRPITRHLMALFKKSLLRV